MRQIEGPGWNCLNDADPKRTLGKNKRSITIFHLEILIFLQLGLHRCINKIKLHHAVRLNVHCI